MRRIHTLFILMLPTLAVLIADVPAPLGQQSAARPPEHEKMERRVLILVNRYRQEHSRLPLGWKESVAVRCRLHSRNMALNLIPAGHQGANERIADIRGSVKVITWAENVAVNRNAKDPVLDAVDGWLKSPGHRKAIEGDFDLTGVGIVMAPDSTFYFTQIFIRSR